MKTFQNKYNLYFLLAALLLIAVYVYLTIDNVGHDGDRGYWLSWANQIKEYGILNVYKADTNYFPFYLYIIGAFSSFFDSFEDLSKWYYLMHYVTFLFDIAGVYLVSQCLKKQYSFGFLLMFAVLNFAFCYNSLIWGQVDAILGFFVFGAIYFLWKDKFIPATIFIALALSFKLQSIVFIPVFGLYFLSKFPIKKWLPNLVAYGLLCIGVIVITCFPFLIEHHRFLSFKHATTNLVDLYPYITMGAANFWSAVNNDNLDAVRDNTLFLNFISFKKLGLMMFFVSSFFALLPLFKQVLYNLKNKVQNSFGLDKLMLSASLVGLSFYLFNTQMHERYSHPVFLFLMCYSFLKKDFFPYILFSLAYFLNMENVFNWYGVNDLHLDFIQRRFIGILYCICYGYLMFRLYNKNAKTNISN